MSGGFAVDLEVLGSVQYLLNGVNEFFFDDATSSLHLSSLLTRLSAGPIPSAGAGANATLTAFGPADDLVGAVADLTRAYEYALEVLQYVLARLEAQTRGLEAKAGETIQAYTGVEVRVESAVKRSSPDK